MKNDRVSISKNTAALAKTDETAEEKVARLHDMDTREVSIVDRAANKRQFIIVKRDGAMDAPEVGEEKRGDTEGDEDVPDSEAKRKAQKSEETEKAKGKAPAGTTDSGKFKGGFDGCVQTQENRGEPADHARAICATIGRRAGKIKSMGGAEVATMADEIISKAQELDTIIAKEDSPVSTSTNVSKIGAPMQADRLNRLKGALSLFKEALGELRSGSVSLEKAVEHLQPTSAVVLKFKKAAGVLGSILAELDVAKGNVVKGQYARDQRGATPFSPNNGSGYQPDTSVIADASAVFGSGVPPAIADILKRQDAKIDALAKQNAGLKSDITKRDSTIQKLHGEVVTIKKTRVAPSTAPYDGEGASPEPNEPVVWARDMASER